MDSKAGVLQTLTVPTEFIAKVFDGTNVLLLFRSWSPCLFHADLRKACFLWRIWSKREESPFYQKQHEFHGSLAGVRHRLHVNTWDAASCLFLFRNPGFLLAGDTIQTCLMQSILELILQVLPGTCWGCISMSPKVKGDKRQPQSCAFFEEWLRLQYCGHSWPRWFWWRSGASPFHGGWGGTFSWHYWRS